jgi:hypothetical protein
MREKRGLASNAETGVLPVNGSDIVIRFPSPARTSLQTTMPVRTFLQPTTPAIRTEIDNQIALMLTRGIVVREQPSPINHLMARGIVVRRQPDSTTHLITRGIVVGKQPQGIDKLVARGVVVRRHPQTGDQLTSRDVYERQRDRPVTSTELRRPITGRTWNMNSVLQRTRVTQTRNATLRMLVDSPNRPWYSDTELRIADLLNNVLQTDPQHHHAPDSENLRE